MSQHLINRYLADLDTLRRVSGANRETVVREAFKDLLKAWGRQHDLHFIPEHEFITPTKERRYIDGALLHALRVPFGYWEAKDSKDDLDEEIRKKFRRGYPKTNIIFDDSVQAVLFQAGQEIMRCPVDDTGQLQRLIGLFFAYERPEIADFKKAIIQFKTDLPAVLDALRERIDTAYDANPDFAGAARTFLMQAQETINPAVTDADVREMLIQHILTEDIFGRVFGQGDFHRENNVARALYDLEQHFFKGAVKQETLRALAPYYAAINSTAALIESHSEKQDFLKALYENFYKVYNPKAADRLGVVYTPNEIVRFMVQGADWLCEKHFGRNLIDRNVEILDPATGTGTFIVELLEHFRGRPDDLKYKYLNELHANEVAILPYYVANLNIEATYAALTGDYAEFLNLCFVDTLDNTAALKTHKGQHYGDLLGGISSENVDRIQRQNERKISVIIGNPPYNANQKNENENNKNREYPEIDQRIKATYVKASTAQKTKLYDMYSRFFRWAADRIEEDGIVAFVTNRGFLDKRNFDGFRNLVAEEFSDIYVVDLGGDVRENPKLSGTTHNVFGIQIGVAISFLVKRRGASGCRIHYGRRPEFETAEEKLVFLHQAELRTAAPDLIQPDAKKNWLRITNNNFESFLPIAAKETRISRVSGQERALFKLYSLGIATNRDDWVYEERSEILTRKITFFIQYFNEEIKRWVSEDRPDDVGSWVGRQIKWTSELESLLSNEKSLDFSNEKIQSTMYRPFTRRFCYYDVHIIHRIYQNDSIFAVGGSWDNIILIFTGPSAQKPWMCSAADTLIDLHYVGAGAGSVSMPRYRYVNGERIDNITDWALEQFVDHYGPKSGVSKDGIFAYVYAVLNDPVYRETYVLDLKREFPRIPFYAGFARWRDWGQALLDLHIGYESVEPYPLKRVDVPDAKAGGQAPRPILKSDRAAGVILLDSVTQLGGVPSEAWDYVLGNRSGIDWVLDQHKERKPKDPTVREKFDTYRFADHKERVVDLLGRVVRVSVETVRITEAMRAAPR